MNLGYKNTISSPILTQVPHCNAEAWEAGGGADLAVTSREIEDAGSLSEERDIHPLSLA